MERTNCPNCGAPLTGCRCEYCGTVDTSAEKRMREDIQRLRVEIDNLMFSDQIRRSVNHFISAGLRPTPPSLPTKKRKVTKSYGKNRHCAQKSNNHRKEMRNEWR